MISRNPIEAVIGAVVLVAALLFVILLYRAAEIRVADGYSITARFFKVGGLQTGSDVRMRGVKVGVVSDLTLEPETFDAVITMSIDQALQLPKDTLASISSDGVLGGKFVSLIPGDASAALSPGEEIEKTRDFKSLEDQVSEIIFLASGGT